MTIRLFTPDSDPEPSTGAHGLSVRDVLDWHSKTDRSAGSAHAQAERLRIRAIFRAALGHLSIADARPFHLLQFIDSQEQLKSDWSRRRWAMTLQAPFNAAARLGLVDRNPFAGLQLPTGPRGRDLTRAEFSAALRFAGTPAFRRVLVFLRYSGARPGELRTVRWCDFDSAQGRISLAKHKTAKKTGKPRRIYLPGQLLKLLAWIRRDQEANGFHADGLIFLNSRRGRWTTQSLCKAFRTIREKADLPSDAKLYGNRHAFGTTLILNGADLATVAELLGHASVKTTLEHYVHLADKTEHLKSACEKAIWPKDSRQA